MSPPKRQHHRLFFPLWLACLLLGALTPLSCHLAIATSFIPATATAESLSPLPVPRRVLVLNSYHPGMRFSDDEVQGIRTTLPQGTEIVLEYMDAKRVQGDSYTAQLASLYAMKYGAARFDTIFSLDDDALRFLLKYGRNLFGDTPVVFCGVNALQPGMLDQQPHITGVLQTIDIETSLDFALRLLPDTKTILVITDPTTTGAANRQTLEQLARSGRFTQPMLFADQAGTGLSLPELLEAVGRADVDTIVYHADFSADKFGNTINIETLIPLLARASNRPIFVHNSMYMGLGALGGKLNSGFDQGVSAAQLALRIWGGSAPADVPLVTDNGNRVMIDDQQRARWKIPIKAVATAAGVNLNEIVFLNKPEDFWRGRGNYVFTALAFIALEGVLIAWLIRLLRRQRQLRAEARSAVQRFRTLFDLAPFACVLIDQQGRYLLVNQAFIQSTGISSAEALGQTSRQAGVIVDATAVRAIRSQLDANGVVNSYEHTITIRQHKELHVLLAAIVIEWQGSPATLMATADITAIRQAELALRESEERYRQLVQSANIIILKFNASGQITFVNDYALHYFGFSEEELLGKDVVDTILPKLDSAGQSLHPLVEATCRGEEQTADCINENITRSGERVWVHWKNRIIVDANGKVSEIISFGSDITERKHAEEEREKLREQLLHAQKMESVGRLAGGIAHDFNNMLGVIIGHAELILHSLGQEHAQQHNLQQILTAAQRSADLTRQLLTYARKHPIAPKVLDLNQSIAEMLAMLRRLIGEQIELVWQPGEGLWPVCLDPTQLTQMLANLCINARDAIAANGRITIVTENTLFDERACALNLDCTPGAFVRITISDSGCGMEADIREKIFEPFFTTKELGQGTGLGLAMVSGIISQNHGFIHLHSEPGQGTEFHLFLPRHLGGEMPIAAAPPTEAYTGSGTILLVEDEPLLLHLSTTMLESLGYTVLGASGGEEALRLVQGHFDAIDLLITDLVMPGMHGRELAARLQRLRPGLRCLFISGYASETIDQARQPFLEKPFTRMALAAKVREVLSQPPAR